jgi:signal recognition particle receptor subunit beta
VAEHVILFTGPMGAGKTTAIRALSEIPVVSTEASNTERHVVDKATTTVALDYGEIVLSNEEKIRMYGIPGQRRFDFMWAILKQRAEGMLLLVNNDCENPVGEMLEFMNDFKDLAERGGVVIGVSRTDVAPEPSTDEYVTALEKAYPERTIPVFAIDPRDNHHMQTALLTLVINNEMRATLGEAGMQQV